MNGLISNIFLSKIKVHSKGLQLEQFIKQVFACFIDGTDMSMASFDARKNDQGYTAIHENKLTQMASSHQIKRFFLKLSIIPNNLYRRILHQLFIWRLRIEKPNVIILGIDTIVLDNDDAKKREGCKSPERKGEVCLYINKINNISNLPCPNNAH